MMPLLSKNKDILFELINNIVFSYFTDARTKYITQQRRYTMSVYFTINGPCNWHRHYARHSIIRTRLEKFIWTGIGKVLNSFGLSENFANKG